MAVSSNASVTVKIFLPLMNLTERVGMSRRATAGSSATLTRLSPGAAVVCIDQLSYCILLFLTSTSIFQHAHVLELWQAITLDQAMVEMATSSNASAAVKISPPIDKSASEGGNEQEGYSGVSLGFTSLNSMCWHCLN